MSLWVERKDRQGRPAVWSIDFSVLPLVVVVGLVVAVYAPHLMSGPTVVARDAAFLIVVGFACFATAKLSVIRRGPSISFGSRRMGKWWRRLYRTGYALMSLGVVLLLVAYGWSRR